MTKTDTEAMFMVKEFPTFPDESWYESISLPISWNLVRGKLKNKKVLDIGCGNGWVSWWARKEGADVTACDIFGTYIHPSIPFVLAPNEKLPFKDGSFDVVLTANVLHHGNLNETAKEVYRVLKNGGRLISLQEPCINNETSEEEYLKTNLQKELDLGIDEHRPSLDKYKEALSIFKTMEFYQMNDTMFVPPIQTELKPLVEENYHGGITISVLK